FDPHAYELLADVLREGRAYDLAAAITAHALALDPGSPALRLSQSWLAMQRGAVDDAILAVVRDPHPTLRARLAEHFAAMARLCPDPQQAARYRTEHHFVAAVERLDERADGPDRPADEHARDL